MLSNGTLNNNRYTIYPGRIIILAGIPIEDSLLERSDPLSNLETEFLELFPWTSCGSLTSVLNRRLEGEIEAVVLSCVSVG